MKYNQNAIHYRDQSHKLITAAQAQKILRKSGTEVTVEEAEKILEFFRPLARMALDTAMEAAERDQQSGSDSEVFLFE